MKALRIVTQACMSLALSAAMSSATLAQDAPAVPAAAPAPADTQSFFPTLPPSRPCNQKSIIGLWKLMHVYESPQGTESAAYTSNPLQYVWFRLNNTYSRYNADRQNLPPRKLLDIMKTHSTGLQQFILQDTGVIYFYQDGKATDTQVCFTVASSGDAFSEGQMLIMPPQGQTAGRLVKVYTKVWSPNQKNDPQQKPGRRARRQQ